MANIYDELTEYPWSIELNGHTDFEHTVLGQRGQTIARVRGHTNARLIAHAPEMLALLLTLNREGGIFDDWAEDNTGGIDEDFDTIHAARALLAKIEGEKS